MRAWLLILTMSAVVAAGVGCDGDDDDSAGDDDDLTADDDDSADDDDTAPADADGDGHDETVDCDDTNPAVFPGAEPVCDDVDDNDCDGAVDPGEEDADGDGHSECDGDCNEFNAAVYPGAEQVCDDGVLDNDCDGLIDANETDSDGDGFTDCDGDCDDDEDAIFPGAYDVEDGIDNDCDEELDEDVIDCDAVPTMPISETQLAGARGYHGLAIDAFGFIVGSDGSSLIRSDYAGNWSVFLPGAGSCEQMTYLPDGDLVIVSTNNGSLMKVTPAGIPSPLAASNGAYGLVYGPDGMLYTAGGNQIRRVDPATGDTATVVNIPGGTAHTVNFNGDGSRMYVGTIGGGQLYRVDLDANFDPTGPAEVHAVFGGWHDGVGVDACGHVFVADYSTNNLYRVSPDGDVAVFVNWGPTGYGHGLIWGNGVGGFREDALYVPLPYNGNRVKEVHVGIPPCTWGGTVHNGP